jgi:hypothetical protein
MEQLVRPVNPWVGTALLDIADICRATSQGSRPLADVLGSSVLDAAACGALTCRYLALG